MTEPHRAGNDAEISTAKITDLEELTFMMDEANEYSRAKSGEPAWRLKELALKELRAHLKADQCFVMKVDQKIVATITITYSDALWGKSGADGTALYIHKLMKHSNCRVPHVGLKFVGFAAHKALQQHIEFLRCDTLSAQKQLVDYYLRLGFVIEREFVYHPSERPGVFLQAPVRDILERIAESDMLKSN